MNADDTHAGRVLTAASKQLELAHRPDILGIAQRSQRRRVLEILAGTEIGGDRLVEVPLLAQ